MSSTFEAPNTIGGPLAEGRALFHFRLVGKVALTVSVVTGLVLVGVVIGVSQRGGTGYAEIIETFSATRHNLGLALLLSSLAVVVLAGLLAWLIAIYGSFRIAGPLYRFARNLETVGTEGPRPVLGIRKGDCLQEESRQLAESIGVLRRHYDEMRALVALAQTHLEAGPSEDPESLAAAVLQLKRTDGKSHL